MRGRLSLIVAAGLFLGLLTACSGSANEVFCDRARTAHQAGPLFPARTDGAPLPNLEALAALEAMAEAAPSEIAAEMQVLVDQAQVLVRAAQVRRENGSSFPDDDRWSQRAVERAQSAVIDYSDTHCDLVLTQTVRPGSQDPHPTPEID